MNPASQEIEYRVIILEKELIELKRQLEHLRPKEPLRVSEVAKIMQRKELTITTWARNNYWFGLKKGRTWIFTYEMIDKMRALKKMKYR